MAVVLGRGRDRRACGQAVAPAWFESYLAQCEDIRVAAASAYRVEGGY